MAGVPGSPGTEGANNEEEVAEDGHHDGDDVEGDPAPLIFLVDNVSRRVRQLHHGVTGGGVGSVHIHGVRIDYVNHLVTVGVKNVGDRGGDGGQVLVDNTHLGFFFSFSITSYQI